MWLLESRNAEDGALIESFNFPNEQVYIKEQLRSKLEQLAGFVQEETVLSMYSQTQSLTTGLIIKMSPYLVQIDSPMQRLLEQCVQQKRYMREFMFNSTDPFATAIRDIAATH